MRRAWILVLASIALPIADGRAQDGCDPSYPTVCIPSPPPDLDCPQITQRNFVVRGDDPHRFDHDHDHIGCEG